MAMVGVFPGSSVRETISDQWSATDVTCSTLAVRQSTPAHRCVTGPAR